MDFLSIKNLISQEQFEIMKKTDPKELQKHGYLVVCETCKEAFLETTLDKVNVQIKSGLWNNPQMWYIKAGKHWLDADLSHKISVVQVYPSGTKAMRFCLTDDWRRGLEGFKGSNKMEAMRNELQYLEESLELQKNF